jgi:hypothetical protein
MISSHSPASATIISAGATGTASTSFSGPVCRSAQRRQHRATGGGAIIHHDNRAARHARRWHIGLDRRAAAARLGKRALRLGLHTGQADAQLPHHLVVEHHLRAAAIDYRADTRLLVPRCAQLAHDQHIQLGPRRQRHFIAQRHAAAQ